MRKLFIEAINFYQAFLSFDRGILAVFAPGGACKFGISCSEYAKRAISKYGIFQGIKLAMIRIWRCR